MANTNKKIELWEGYEVELNEDLMDDFDYIHDLKKAFNNEDLGEIIALQFAIVGGDKVYEDAREYLIKEYGRVSLKGLQEITKKIDNAFPKAGNRAQRRSWQTTR